MVKVVVMADIPWPMIFALAATVQMGDHALIRVVTEVSHCLPWIAILEVLVPAS